MATIKDIANKCGVSTSTVSKALNGYRDISDDKREEIKKAAVELGYLSADSGRHRNQKRPII